MEAHRTIINVVGRDRLNVRDVFKVSLQLVQLEEIHHDLAAPLKVTAASKDHQPPILRASNAGRTPAMRVNFR